MALRDLLRRARDRARSAPDDPSPIDALLAEYGEAVDRHSRSRLPWTFRRMPDTDLYRRAIEVMLEDARAEGYRLGIEEMSDRVARTCICTCRAHGRRACRICTNLDRCPVHGTGLADEWDEEMLESPELTAQALQDELTDATGGEATPWRLLEEHERIARIEAVRRVVTAAFTAAVHRVVKEWHDSTRE